MAFHTAAAPSRGRSSLRPVVSALAAVSCLAMVFLSAGGAEQERTTPTGDPLVDWNPVRTWKSIDGRELSAELVAVDGDSVSLKLAAGKIAPVELAQLVDDDRRFAVVWGQLSRFFDLNRGPDRNISNTAQAGIFDGSFAKEGKVHESRNFRFECDAPLSGVVVRDFARLFEATFAAICQHPLALATADPEGGKFVVRLFANREDYLSAGGLDNSAGLYDVNERVILVPVESLGLSWGPSGYRKTREYDPATLIHETTHALTHQWLDSMPMWFIEGFAEYIAAIPYRDGTLDFNRIDEGIRDRVQKKWERTRQRFEPMLPEEFVPLGKAAFMGLPEPEPEPIELIPVEPVKIELTREKPDPITADDAQSEEQEMKPAGGSVMPVPPEGPEPKPPGGPARRGPDFSVLNRYTSSMLLVHHLLHREQVGDVRKYLFALLDGLRDRATYLREHQAAFVEFKEKVDAQISAFDKELDRHREVVRAYNASVVRKQNGEIVEVPSFPRDPVVPQPLPVPDILANPRSPEELSDDGIRAKARAYLKIPHKLAVH